MIFPEVDYAAVIENTADVVVFCEVVEGAVAVDGEVGCVVDVEPVVRDDGE